MGVPNKVAGFSSIMKLHLFLLCLMGLVPITFPIPLPHSALFYVQEVMSWPDAQSYCRMKYTDLLRVQDQRVLLKLRELVANNIMVTWPLWIGLYNDVDSWRWSFNDLPLRNTTFVNWYSGEPDNYYAQESCGHLSGSGVWKDQPCTALKPFICYNEGNSGADRFIGVSNPALSWSEAQSYCREFHTDLASALDQTDNDLLTQVVLAQGSSWFGLFRDTWKWVNDTIASDLQWIPGQPNNAQHPESCGSFYQGNFQDEACSAGHYFLCESISPIRRIQMKLKVKSDGSVLDPAVQSSILDQIKQKLDENGILNTTVSWRVQPDGNVFHKEKKDEL
ncbi:putative C-type lectin domain family 20 member A [Neoarius graeffei]|uniref:putative C-type lectin domain family 20 member A n=1 Tax=Neoarius graeffei TaxID=443677 RepID=UPI00298CD332|nr:putative C-type lectin domain family 20 member A [Neoarius graeffei]